MTDADDPTRSAWADASEKYVREYDELLADARDWALLPAELAALDGLVAGADVVHPMSGHGLDDLVLARLGARSIIGLDYSEPSLDSARRRAAELGFGLDAIRYAQATLPETALPDGCADLVYTGKGALIWVRDLDAFVAEMRRLLRPGGRFYVYEAHPLVPLWTWEEGVAAVRDDRSYFATSHVNDSFPGRGAVESQHRLSEIVMAFVRAGFAIEHVGEHPDPFWRPSHVDAAAWDGRLPNAFDLLARRD